MKLAIVQNKSTKRSLPGWERAGSRRVFDDDYDVVAAADASVREMSRSPSHLTCLIFDYLSTLVITFLSFSYHWFVSSLYDGFC